MSEIDILIPGNGARRWHLVLAQRLAAKGHDVRVIASSGNDAWPPVLDMLLSIEARLGRDSSRLSSKIEQPARAEGRADALTVDLAGAADSMTKPAGPAIALRFDGSPSASAAATALAANRLPTLTLLLDGTPVAEARPMVDGRLMVGRGLEDVLARAVSLVVASIEKFLAGALAPLPTVGAQGQVPDVGAVAASLATSVLPRLTRESVRRLRHWPAHWRVGYRFHTGRGVAETCMLSGPDWSILPDDGQRYYADPFAFEHKGRHFLFVEEFPHASGKGIISVAEFDTAGRPSTPRVVIEEPFHLSYPQVFSHGGKIWMLPEGGAGRGLVLYRAEAFPDRWVRHAVLIEDRELFDATLLEHNGRFWLLAAERDGVGSTSDMMVAFHADRLEGPWTPHKANPILIDRAAARPGGAFAKVGRRIVRPVQDGTSGYGGGLGLSDLIRLDEDAVQFSTPVGILPARNWPHPRIHTLNRAGALEVIDGLADVKRKGGGLQAA